MEWKYRTGSYQIRYYTNIPTKSFFSQILTCLKMQHIHSNQVSYNSGQSWLHTDHSEPESACHKSFLPLSLKALNVVQNATSRVRRWRWFTMCPTILWAYMGHLEQDLLNPKVEVSLASSYRKAWALSQQLKFRHWKLWLWKATTTFPNTTTAFPQRLCSIYCSSLCRGCTG